jgi:outer membrane protein assembly factor BamB
MTFDVRRRLAAAVLGAAAAFLGAPAQAADAPTFADIEGWWGAEPSHGGESSRILLHFVDEQGKQTVRLSMLAIGGFDVPVGTVKLGAEGIDMAPIAFALRFDRAAGTLSGLLPEAAVPVYRIPVEFRRIAAPEKPPLPTFAAPAPRVRWVGDVKAPVWAGLAHDAETARVFVATDAGVVHAIETAGAPAGSTAWTFDTGKAIKARPAIVGDAVYVVSDSGFLHRLDKRTGAERWRAKVDDATPPRLPGTDEKSRWDRYGSSVVLDGGRLYVASRDKSLRALDVASGKELWRVTAGDIMTATPAVWRDLVVFADYAGIVQAVAAKDGTPRWRYDARLPVAGDLVVDDAGRVFVGSRSYDLIALDAATGRELWKHYYWFSWIESPPVVRDATVYTGSSDGVGVYAIDVATGARRWTARVPGWAWARTAVDERLVVAGTVGYGAWPGVRSGSLVGIDRHSGVLRWLHVDPPGADVVAKKAEWGFAAGPVLFGGTVYAADLSGRVFAIDPM